MDRDDNLRDILPYLLLACTALYFIFTFLTRSAYLGSYFLPDTSDTFMDYFNMLVNVQVGDPYYANSNYPPICFIFFKLMFHFVPQGLTPVVVDKTKMALNLRSTMQGMLPFVVYYVVTIVVIVVCIGKMLEKAPEKRRLICSLSIVFSGPFLFLLERGNILLLSLTCLFVFFAYRNSSRVTLRFLACLALALSAALKLYPTVFLLLYIRERRFKAFLVTLVLEALLLLAPFALFGGLESFNAMINGLLISTNANESYGIGFNYSFKNMIMIVSALFLGTKTSISMLVVLFVSAISVASCFVLKREWEIVLLLGMICILVPGFSYTYALTMLYPGLVLFMNSNDRPSVKIECIALLLFVICSPAASPLVVNVAEALQFEKLPLYWWHVLGNASLAILFFEIEFEALRDVLSLFGERKLR